MVTAAAHLSASGSAAAVSASLAITIDYWEKNKQRSSFMPYDTRGGMIMNKGVAIVGFVVFAGYAILDILWVHNHVLDRPGGEER